MTAIRLLLVDNHLLMRQSLAQADDLIVVAEAESVQAALEQARQHQPQVVIIDVQLPDGSGMTACAHILKCCPGTAVVLLSTDDLDVYLALAYAAGGAAFLVKTFDFHRLVQVVQAASQGKRSFSARQTRRIETWQEQVEPRLQELTEREWEVLRLMADGDSNSDIAKELHISVRTVESHVSEIRRKLKMKSRRSIRAWTRRTGVLLIPLESRHGKTSQQSEVYCQWV